MTMDRARKRECLEVLELPEDASIMEVKNAYQHLKDLYTKGSIALSPIEDDFPDATKVHILQSIEEAYLWLVTNFEKPGEGDFSDDDEPDVVATAATRNEISEIKKFDGSTLRRVREMLGIELGEVEFSTKIHPQYIKNIEEDKFDALPEEVFVRGYLSKYAKFLGLNSRLVVETYIKRYQKGRKPSDH